MRGLATALSLAPACYFAVSCRVLLSSPGTNLRDGRSIEPLTGRSLRQPDEPTIDFIARVWSTPQQLGPMVRPNFDTSEAESVTDELEEVVTHDEPQPDHLHVPLTDGREICPAVAYGYLSELMHGRVFSDAIRWSAGQLVEAGGGVEPQAYGAVGLVTDTLALCIRQIRLAAASLAESANRISDLAALTGMGDTFTEATAEEMLAAPPINSPERRFAKPPLPALMPLLPKEGLDHGPMSVLRQGAVSLIPSWWGGSRTAITSEMTSWCASTSCGIDMPAQPPA